MGYYPTCFFAFHNLIFCNNFDLLIPEIRLHTTFNLSQQPRCLLVGVSIFPCPGYALESESDLGASGESEDAHQQVYGDESSEHKGKLSHEVVAGAAAFEGFKLFEDNQRKEGTSNSHCCFSEALCSPFFCRQARFPRLCQRAPCWLRRRRG